MMWLLCFFGGIGAMARYVLDVSIQRSWNRSFPLSTLVINGIASLCAGIAMMSYYAQSVDFSDRHAVPDRFSGRVFHVLDGHQ